MAKGARSWSVAPFLIRLLHRHMAPMHDLFLCHTGIDKDWTRALGERLEQEQIGRRSVKVFLDEWDIDYGKNIIDQIDKGLRESRYVGLVLSPAMLRAEWPTAEWQSQVMDDPAGRRGKILPLLLHKFDPITGAPINLPFVLKAVKRFDFSEHSRFSQEFERLLRKLADEPLTRGKRSGSGRGGLGSAIASVVGQEVPDSIEEVLPSNLLPILRLPATLYSAPTDAERKTEIWNKIKNTPPFFLHAHRLYSFAPHKPKGNVFKPVVSGFDNMAEAVHTWLGDRERAGKIIGLLNAALRDHCYHLDIWATKTRDPVFYCPILESEARQFTWGHGRPRTLAKMKDGPGGSKFGVHMAAHMRFIQLGTKLYLLIEPAWMFTSDGIKPVEGPDMGVLSTKWGGKEKNAALLRNVVMWAFLLADGKKDIEINVSGASEDAVRLSIVPAHTGLKVGLVGDQIRLDRILRGDGAGERRLSGSAESETQATDETELDQVAENALVRGDTDNGVGELTPDEERDRSTEDDELELPF
jgi:hypothetical protein